VRARLREAVAPAHAVSGGLGGVISGVL